MACIGFHRWLAIPQTNVTAWTRKNFEVNVDSMSHEGASSFATTRWTIVLQTRGRDAGGQRALADLCRIYWMPLYAYARRWGRQEADAEDAVQEFFAKILRDGLFEGADPARGRLRSYLLTAFQHFLRREHVRDFAAKRRPEGGWLALDVAAAEVGYRGGLADNETPESAFERRWALTVLDQALFAVRNRYAGEGREALFELLRPHLVEGAGHGEGVAAAEQAGMAPGQFRVALHRVRARFREALREVVRETVRDEAELDAELRYLRQRLGGSSG